MNSDRIVDIAIEYLEKINRRDFDGLLGLMSPHHRLVSEKGETIVGPEKAREALTDYTSKYPEFQIHISDIYLIENTVVAVGRTTGSCTGLTRGVEIRRRLIYVIRVEEGSVAEFKYAIDDTDQVRNDLVVCEATKITE